MEGTDSRNGPAGAAPIGFEEALKLSVEAEQRYLVSVRCKRPIEIFLLSAFLPGTGTISAGAGGRGFLLLIAWLTSAALIVFGSHPLFLFGICAAIWTWLLSVLDGLVALDERKQRLTQLGQRAVDEGSWESAAGSGSAEGTP